MADSTFIEAFYARHHALHEYLMEQGEISFAAELNTTFTRSLVLAVASFFEHEVTAIVRGVPVQYANAHPVITAIIERQAITRKYHTWFDWDNLKPGAFLALFGDDYRVRANAKLKADVASSAAMKAFLELGQTRNKLVHQNYVMFDVQKTPGELIEQFRVALPVLEFMNQTLFPPAVEAAPQSPAPVSKDFARALSSSPDDVSIGDASPVSQPAEHASATSTETSGNTGRSGEEVRHRTAGWLPGWLADWFR